MTIQSAITKAKSSYNWSIVPHEPTGVCVRYKTKDGALRETDFGLQRFKSMKRKRIYA